MNKHAIISLTTYGFFLLVNACKNKENDILPGQAVGNIRIHDHYKTDMNNENFVVVEENGKVVWILCKDEKYKYKGVNLIGLTEIQFKIAFPDADQIKENDKFHNKKYKITDGLIVEFEDQKIYNFGVYHISSE